MFQDTVVPFWTYFVRDGGIDHLGHGGESIYEALLQVKDSPFFFVLVVNRREGKGRTPGFGLWLLVALV